MKGFGMPRREHFIIALSFAVK